MKNLCTSENPRRVRLTTVSSVLMWSLSLAVAGHTQAADQQTNPPPVRQHTEQSFQQLQQHEQRTRQPDGQSGQGNDSTPTSPSRGNAAQDAPGKYSPDHFLIGRGQGDLSKGKIVCQRVSELAARTDLAKQIRVLVKEHATDRVLERAGRDAEQDIEVIREEIVQEYLLGVKIVDRQVDEASGTCSSTAVMSKNQIAPRPAPDSPEPTPTVIR
ncbi:MAG TPA: hypothetical protein VJM82_05945 [Nitrospiraceae bacterium]|nr:hypothetical protein [Nitrospiraceae bacterium]